MASSSTQNSRSTRYAEWFGSATNTYTQPVGPIFQAPRLTPKEREELTRGPELVLLIGSTNSRYQFRHAVLSHYSGFLASLIRDLEARNPRDPYLRITLPDITTREMNLVDFYVHKGYIPCERTKFEATLKGCQAIIEECISFLALTRRFELGEMNAADRVNEPLRIACDSLDILIHKDSANKGKVHYGITAEDIENIWRFCPPGSEVRTRAVECALAYEGPNGVKAWQEQLGHLGGFHEPTMECVIKVFQGQAWGNPVTRFVNKSWNKK